MSYNEGRGEVNIICTGSQGFLGQHLMTYLRTLGHDPYGVPRPAYDLRNPAHIEALFTHTGPPDIIFHLAAHVGGIQYNIDHPAELFYDNVVINTQLIHQAMLRGCGKFVMVGTVCSYPAHNPIPTREKHLWTGYPEESNGPYGVAKLMAWEQLKAYRAQYGLNFAYPILSNLYGPGGKPDAYKSHVIPALVKKFLDNPPKIEIWGDGSPTRDFLYVEDAAEALCRFLDVDYCEPVNIAGGVEIAIRWLVKSLTEITNYQGEVVYDLTKPNGQLRRGYDNYVARSVLKWQAKTNIETGLRRTVEFYASPGNDQ